MVVKKYRTENRQYFYDASDDYLFNELEHEYGSKSNQWFEPLMNQLNEVLKKSKSIHKTALHIGSSTGRITFELAKSFESVSS